MLVQDPSPDPWRWPAATSAVARRGLTACRVTCATNLFGSLLVYIPIGVGFDVRGFGDALDPLTIGSSLLAFCSLALGGGFMMAGAETRSSKRVLLGLRFGLAGAIVLCLPVAWTIGRSLGPRATTPRGTAPSLEEWVMLAWPLVLLAANGLTLILFRAALLRIPEGAAAPGDSLAP